MLPRFVICAARPNAEPVRVPLEGEVVVGKSVECALQLRSGAIARRHARFFEQDGRVYVLDLGSTNGIAVNGSRLRGPMAVTEADVITIESWTLTLERAAPRGPLFAGRTPQECELVAALTAAPNNEELRLVYADWLEENGFQQEAELLRLERVIVAERAAGTDLAWRALVMSPDIERCDERACPSSWSALAPTDDAFVRRCAVCAKHVHFAQSIEVARESASSGRPLVVDPALSRTWDDLIPPPLRRARASPTLDLPFFRATSAGTMTARWLRESLGVPAAATGEPLTGLVQRLTFEVDGAPGPDAALRSFAFELRVDVDQVERFLRERHPAPVDVRSSSKSYRRYGALLFRRMGDLAEIRWDARRGEEPPSTR